MQATTGTNESADGDLGSPDRRKVQLSFTGTDRRSGKDRRANPRISSE